MLTCVETTGVKWILTNFWAVYDRNVHVTFDHASTRELNNGYLSDWGAWAIAEPQLRDAAPKATELHRFCCLENASCHPSVPLIVTERTVIKWKVLKLAKDTKGNLNMDIHWVRAPYTHVSHISSLFK